MEIFEGDAPRRTLSVRMPAEAARGQGEGRARAAADWMAVRLAGREGVNSLFSYELVLKADEAGGAFGASVDAIDVDLDAWVGREIGCRIELDGAGIEPLGAGVREINAIVAEACLWGEEGRHVQVRLTLRPWLHLATLRTDCRIFQNRTVVEIVHQWRNQWLERTRRSNQKNICRVIGPMNPPKKIQLFFLLFAAISSSHSESTIRDKNKFSFSYPPDWVQTQDKDRENCIFLNKKKNGVISNPEQWEIRICSHVGTLDEILRFTVFSKAKAAGSLREAWTNNRLQQCKINSPHFP